MTTGIAETEEQERPSKEPTGPTEDRREDPLRPSSMSLLREFVLLLVIVAIAAATFYVTTKLDVALQALAIIVGILLIVFVIATFGAMLVGRPGNSSIPWTAVVLGGIVFGTIAGIVNVVWNNDWWPTSGEQYPHDSDCRYFWAFLLAVFPFALLDVIWIKSVTAPRYLASFNTLGKDTEYAINAVLEDKLVIEHGIDVTVETRRDLLKAARPDPVLKKPRLWVGLLAWSLICAGLAVFAVMHVLDEDANTWVALGWGAAYGFVTSGFYALTLRVAFRPYSWHLAFLDTAWGVVLAAGTMAYVRYWANW